ncbi:hypothetical protein V6N12_068144 [Hibiscus sabdariffa]|uniref:Uncharacterized protein n=1 Tax=Hibiscus sabdariffa TaxID=183260 RepID=A0ABR2FPE1_9ROSI
MQCSIVFDSFVAAHHAPLPAPAQSGGGSMLGGIGSTIAQGMAFGTGSAVAHRAVDAVMGPRTIQHETVVSEAAAAPAPAATVNSFSGSDACSIHTKAFQDLRKRNQQVPVLHGHVGRVQEELRVRVGCLKMKSLFTISCPAIGIVSFELSIFVFNPIDDVEAELHCYHS